jgi:hypothetical protein
MATYLCEKCDGGYVLATSPESPTLAGSIRWALTQGDGLYTAGPVADAPWSSRAYPDSNSTEAVNFEVEDGHIAVPDRSDWEAVAHGSYRAARISSAAIAPIPRQTNLWVVKPGPLSSEGLLHDPGTCLSRSPLPGDKLLDMLTIGWTEDGLEVSSLRQQKDDYDWTPEGPRFNRDRRAVTEVKIGGRAGSWGTLGDDSYDPGSADDILVNTLLEAALGVGAWILAFVYYDTREVTDGSVSTFSPIMRIALKDYQPEPDSPLGSRLTALAELCRAEDRRPVMILKNDR